MKVIKKIVSVFLVAALSVSPVNTVFFNNKIEIKADNNPLAYSDDEIVDSRMIEDSELLAALKQIIGKGKNFTFGELKSYNGDLNFSGYPGISDVKGLGFAVKAKSMDLSNTKVHYIYANEFKKCEFESFVLPNTIVEIEDAAFEQCSNLKTINFPEGLLKIKQTAFALCTSLDNITLPDSLIKIGNGAFQSCDSLKSIVIPDGLDALSENADEDLDNGIGTDVFKGCKSLSSVTLGSGMRAIPAGCFSKNTSLLSIVIPAAITDIRENAFSQSGLVSIDLSKNTKMTAIKKAVFDGCWNLKNIKLPTSIESIGYAAFQGGAYENTEFLRNLTKLETLGEYCFAASDATKAYIPPKVRDIGNSCFRDSDLEEVEIADFVEDLDIKQEKRIGAYCFKGTNLASVTFPTANEDNANISLSIDESAFEYCNNLRRIVAPKNLISIGNKAFFSCSKDEDYIQSFYLTRISSWDDVSDKYFAGAKKYTVYSSTNEKYYYGRVVYINPDSFDMNNNITIYTEEEIEGATVVNKERSATLGLEYVDLSRCRELALGTSVFESCEALEEAYLPDCLTEIPDRTFKYCSCEKRNLENQLPKLETLENPELDIYGGLRHVEMSENVTKIGNEAFFNCVSLKMDDIPQKLEYICDGAYRYCSGLKKITLPSTLKYIGEYAFDECVRAEGGFAIPNSGLCEIIATNASSLEYIGRAAFRHANIKSFELNADSKVSVLFRETFYRCEYLRIATFPKTLGYIQRDCFGLCYRISTLKIPDSCTIDEEAFYSSQSLSEDALTTDARFLEDVPVHVTQNSAGKKIYFVTASIPGIVVDKTFQKATVLVNGDLVIPFNVCPAQTGCAINTVKIGNEVYTYNDKESVLVGNTTGVALIPTMSTDSRRVYYSNPLKETTSSVVASSYKLTLAGVEESKQLSVQLNSVISFKNSIVTGRTTNADADYIIDVKENTCTDIEIDNLCNGNRYVPGNESKKYTITPDFIGYFIGEKITDIPEWRILNGEDNISNIKVADDHMSLDFSTVKGKYGDTLVEVSAGTVTKKFYIKVCSPITNLSLDGSTKDMCYNTSAQFTLNITNSGTAENVEKYPDNVIVNVLDDSIVSVSDVKMNENHTKLTYTVNALSFGSTDIEFRSASGKCIVMQHFNVVSSDLKVLLYDADGNQLKDGDDLYIRGTNGLILFYDFSDDISTNEINAVTEVGKKLSVKVEPENKKLYIDGVRLERTTLTVYPIEGTAEANGTVLNVHVNADVQKISLRSASLETGEIRNILSYMYNEFGSEHKITAVENADDFGLITDNYIEFKSSNENCATVDECGRVTALKAPADGNKITITCNAYRDGVVVASASANISIKGPVVETTIPNIEPPTTSHVEPPTGGNGGEPKTTVNNNNNSNNQQTTNQSSGNGSNISGNNNNQQSGSNSSGNTSNSDSSNGSSVNNDSSNNQDSHAVNVSGTKIKKALRAKNNKQIKVTYNSVSGASYYEVSYSTSKNFKKGTETKKFKKTSAVLKKLSKKKYFVRVRVVKVVNGQKYFSKWSSKKTVKVKK
jgi:hypothetical protein